MNLLLLLILGSIWGTSFLFIKIIVGEVGPLTLVSGRLMTATLLIWLLLHLRRIPVPRGRKLWTTYAVLGLLNGALPYALISWGEQYIASGWAALLQSMTPIFTILLAHLLTRDDRITAPKAFGVALGFGGIGVLMWPELQDGLSASFLGMVAVVAAAASYALASIFARRHLQGEAPIASAAGQFTMGLAYILPLAFIFERPLTISPSWTALGSWITLSVLGTVVAYILYFVLLERTSATFTTMVTYIVPINGLILGSLILHEPLSPMVLISLGAVLGGVLLVRQSGDPDRRRQQGMAKKRPPSVAKHRL